MPDAHANFAVSTVATAPSPANSGTTLVVAAGHGARFPAVPFNATVWPANASPDPTNAEIVRVTARSTDTLTITRAQESTSARSIVVGDRIAATITVKTITDIETGAALPLVAQGQAGLAPAISGTPSSSRVLSETGWKAEAAGGGYTAVRQRKQRFVNNRSSSGTTKTITTVGPHDAAVGDTITVSGNVGGSGYTGTFTVTSVTSNTITYTGSASSTEGTTATGAAYVSWIGTITARTEMVVAGPNALVQDKSGRTEVTFQGQFPTPLAGNGIAPLSTGVINNSFTNYETTKFAPIILPEAGVTWSQVRCRVQATSTLGVARFGIYTSSNLGQPQTLIQEFGSANVLGGGFAFALSVNMAFTTPEAGLYFLALCFNGGNGTPGAQEVNLMPLDYLNSGTFPLITSYQQTGITGALASNGGSSTPTNPDRAPAFNLLR